jgi:hypothetical protein
MALGHKKFCDSRRFFEGRQPPTRIFNPPYVKLACKRMLQNKKQATIVDCFLREGYTTPGYSIRPLVKLASVYVSRVFFTLEYFLKSFNRD